MPSLLALYPNPSILCQKGFTDCAIPLAQLFKINALKTRLSGLTTVPIDFLQRQRMARFPTIECDTIINDEKSKNFRYDFRLRNLINSKFLKHEPIVQNISVNNNYYYLI